MIQYGQLAIGPVEEKIGIWIKTMDVVDFWLGQGRERGENRPNRVFYRQILVKLIFTN